MQKKNIRNCVDSVSDMRMYYEAKPERLQEVNTLVKNLNKMKLDEELLTFVNGGALVPREDTILVDEDDLPYHGKNVPGGNEDFKKRCPMYYNFTVPVPRIQGKILS